MATTLKLGRLGIELTLDADDFKSGIKGIKSSLGKLIKLGGAVGAGLGAGLLFAIKSFADLEQAATNAAAVTKGKFSETFAAFKAAAMDAAAGSLFSAKEAAQALEYLARAGLSAGQSIGALKPVLAFATANNMDLASATDIATDIMTAFGLTVAQLPALLDQLSYTAATSNTNVRMLGEAMKYVAPAAAAFEQSTADVNAILGTLASAGIKSSQAGTSLRMMFLRLAGGGRQVAKGIKTLGTSVYDASGNFRSMLGVVADLEKAQKRLSPEQFSAAIKQAFGAESLGAALIMLKKGAKGLREYSKEIEKSTGKTKEMADLMANTVHGQFKIFKGNVQTLAAKIGSMMLPMLKAINTWLINTVNSVLKSDTAFENFKSALIIASQGAIGLIKSLGFVVKAGIWVAGVVGTVIKGLRLMASVIEGVAIAAAGFYLIASDPKNAHRHTENIRSDLDKLHYKMEKLSKTSPFSDALRSAEVFDGSLKGLIGSLELGLEKMKSLKREKLKALMVANSFAQSQGAPKGSGGKKPPKDAKKPALSAIDSVLKKLDGKIHVEVRIPNKESKLKEVTKEIDQLIAQPYIDAREELKERARKNAIIMEESKGLAIDGLRALGDALGMGDNALGRAAMGAVDGLQSATDPLQAMAMVGRAWAQGLVGMVLEHEKTQQHLSVLRQAVADMGIPDALGGFLEALEPGIGAFVQIMRDLKPIADLLGGGELKELVAGGFLAGIKNFFAVVLKLAEIIGHVSLGIATVGQYISDAIWQLVSKMAEWAAKIGIYMDISAFEDLKNQASDNVDSIKATLDAIEQAQQNLKEQSIASGQAIYDETKQRAKLNEQLKEGVLNGPSGWKVNWERFNATRRGGIGPAGVGSRGQGMTVNGDVTVMANDSETMKREIKRMNFLQTGSTMAAQNVVMSTQKRSYALWGA